MSSKLLFRENAAPDVRSAPIDWWWGLVAAVFIVTFLGVTHQLDKRDQLAHQAAADAAAEAARRTREALVPTVHEAYEQGQRDALLARGCSATSTRAGL